MKIKCIKKNKNKKSHQYVGGVPNIAKLLLVVATGDEPFLCQLVFSVEHG